jgi:hypothetical protein
VKGSVKSFIVWMSGVCCFNKILRGGEEEGREGREREGEEGREGRERRRRGGEGGGSLPIKVKYNAGLVAREELKN